mmetsp:Transcript_29722/g.36880  ORF Transcript_29722/g.36880 Transcript_29722/m.36880 type:complete len:81 (+) Transcript_29722:234-476(+)|eukprot:CAMPEP_0170462588 /NCGR_PEP_ID=MMETSP0123-20130129/8039_1 /TAXON_ID=182087 /ORGANISM="Favella ehrenbergii, Strain Fehren 1" /LENGTH=80 /DNA_ID=CAMNT_0010727849 /DNA_START=234 /DNA_END=476 /DNA_ORIENTATION=-
MKKPPVLIQHGFGDSASGYIKAKTFNKSWILSVADMGYDIWLGNNRGVPYSNKNDRDGEWSLEERWDFSWADMGIYDMPT